MAKRKQPVIARMGLPVVVVFRPPGRVGSIVHVRSLESDEEWIQVQAGMPEESVEESAARAMADGDVARLRSRASLYHER